MGDKLLKRGHAAAVLFNRDDAGRAGREQCPGQPARPGPHLQYDGRRLEPCCVRDLPAQAGVEEEVLAERAPGLQPVPCDDGGKRR